MNKELNDLQRKEQHLLCETVADIAFIAGARRYYSGDSRADVEQFIAWAHEFEATRAVSSDGEYTYLGRAYGTTGSEYLGAIEEFALRKMDEAGHYASYPQAVIDGWKGE